MPRDYHSPFKMQEVTVCRWSMKLRNQGYQDTSNIAMPHFNVDCPGHFADNGLLEMCYNCTYSDEIIPRAL
jgi:hypothetical protein